MVKLSLALLTLAVSAFGQSEDDYYRIVTIPVPSEVKMEAGGLALLPDGRLAAAVRKGEVWIAENAEQEPPARVRFRLFASGLHEPLGLAYRGGDLYLMQRSELTRLRDTDGDGSADEYRTVAKGWGVTGNYHEYAYGPKFTPDGRMWITLNQTIGKSDLDPDDAWRGWSAVVNPDGSWEPLSSGLRSPCGLGVNHAGDVFFTDQQGNWVPTNSLQHIRKGVFHGHADSLRDCRRPGASCSFEGPVPQGIPIPDAARRIPGFALPAIWFPYRKMGMSATDVLLDTTQGKFGPFRDQLFVGDFTLSLIMRVWLEKVEGEYQGAAFPFREGFDSAVVRMEWGRDGSMFVGMTNRGWNSLGTRSFGLQRLVWTGKTPFEVETMRALPDGFELTFTTPVNPEAAARVSSYRMSSYTYLYHSTYGSPEIDAKDLSIRQARVGAGNRSVRLTVDGLREGYVHELHLPGLRSVGGAKLLHASAYYTLNRIPRERSR